jgi:hypothetical protein
VLKSLETSMLVNNMIHFIQFQCISLLKIWATSYHFIPKNCVQGSAAFKDLVKLSSSFNPSSGDFASPNNFTIALPTMTPSAPHPATCYKRKKFQTNTALRQSIGIKLHYAKSNSYRFWRQTCLTCSGFDMPKPTATGLVVVCHKKKIEMRDV